MPEEIICPHCGRSDYEERTRRIAAGSGRGRNGMEYPREEEYTYYICNNCGREFGDIVE